MNIHVFCLFLPFGSQENKCKVFQIISKDLEKNCCEMMASMCLRMLTSVVIWNTRSIQLLQSTLMIIELLQLMLKTMKMLSSYLLKKKLWICLRHLTTWIHQRWTRKNLAMLQEVKIREGLRVVITNQWRKKVNLDGKI